MSDGLKPICMDCGGVIGWDCQCQQPSVPAPCSALVRPDFVARMEAELLANQRKGDWRQWQPSQLEVLAELEHHVAKLIMSLAANERGAQNKAIISEHCADIANIAMKAEERFGWPNT